MAVRIGLLARASNLLAAPSHSADFGFSILDFGLGSKIVESKSKIRRAVAFVAAFVAPTVAGQQRRSRPASNPPPNFGFQSKIQNLKSKIDVRG